MKNSRAISCANTWKSKEINKLSDLKENLLRNQVDKESIDIYINLEYNMIINKYNKKIKKIQSDKNNEIDIINKEKKKAIQYLIESRIYLENANIDPQYIKNQSNIKYNKINDKFNNKKNNIKKPLRGNIIEII